MICLFFKSLKLRGHVVSALFGAEGCQLVFQKSQLTVYARHLTPHRPVVNGGQKSHHWVKYAQDRNEQDDQLTNQLSHPERKIIVQEWGAGFVEPQRVVAQRKANGFRGRKLDR